MDWLATVDGGLHAQGRHNSKLRCLVMHDDALVDGSWLTLSRPQFECWPGVLISKHISPSSSSLVGAYPLCCKYNVDIGIRPYEFFATQPRLSSRLIGPQRNHVCPSEDATMGIAMAAYQVQVRKRPLCPYSGHEEPQGQ